MQHPNDSTHLEQAQQLLPTEAEIRDLRSALSRRMISVPDVDAAWAQMAATISEASSAADVQAAESIAADESRGRSLRRWALYAAIAAAACLAVFFLMKHKDVSSDNHPGITLLAQKAAGTDVTMTVEQVQWDGKRATKSEEHIAAGSAISFKKQQADNSPLPNVILMATPRGKDCHLTLSDGTRVWMNADSQLEFPEHFSGARRTVRLSGEAYFEVAKDRKHPFVVESPYFTTTVLGTTFNVRAYSPSDASVALVEGRVSVKPNTGGRALVMNPGQLASMKAGQKGLSLTTVDTYSYTQRKDGFFYFPDDTLREIMVELGRWYNKTVVFEEAGDMDMRLHFVAERSQSLPQIINSLSEMDGVDIVLGSNEIVVK